MVQLRRYTRGSARFGRKDVGSGCSDGQAARTVHSDADADALRQALRELSRAEHIGIRTARLDTGVVVVRLDADLWNQNGAMAVAVHKDGSLLVRVDPAEDVNLLAKPHVFRAQMGTGRSMGEGWLQVEATGLRKDPALADWLAAATRNLAQRKPVHSRAS